jgi:hypothetical protein
VSFNVGNLFVHRKYYSVVWKFEYRVNDIDLYGIDSRLKISSREGPNANSFVTLLSLSRTIRRYLARKRNCILNYDLTPNRGKRTCSVIGDHENEILTLLKLLQLIHLFELEY